MSSLLSTPTPLRMGPEVTKKPAAAPAPGNGAAAEFLSGKPLNPSGDKANLIDFWPSCLLQHAQLREAMIAATKPLEVMDMACGTGVVSSYIHTLMKEMEPAQREKLRLTSADSSEAQLGIVQEKITREGWLESKVVQADIMNMSFPSETFDFIIVANALMLVADPYASLRDTRDAVACLGLPGQQPVSWPQSSIELTTLWGPGAWHSPTFAKSMFTAAGFVDVEVEIATNWVPFSSADQWCTVFQAFMHGVTERFWTKEQREKLKGELMPTIKAFLEKKYQGKPFKNERIILLTRGRKPEL
ncbi:S-adenosyl-L-methionine-dependent methyltransferase [Colletotrichum zoysiae]|uniref:S-adenosyl-L-methionine-dependent methyltransferase n=1 Tax=Colletotrichum zoysiae TaxID=1216348 RepID=A0AAD9LWJ5_9PEZI|nr:S-adenosyl-L-methionine-dependent methyltransferase [Colletotrichum zoysiae]